MFGRKKTEVETGFETYSSDELKWYVAREQKHMENARKRGNRAAFTASQGTCDSMAKELEARGDL